jgi:thiol-disulfide isomerase/thioredoxin
MVSRSIGLPLTGLAALAGVALVAAPVRAAEAREPSTSTEAATSIPWEKDFKSALAKARESGRPLMVDFWAEWCHWCHQLDATTYRDPDVVALARDFVAVKVNTEGSLGEVELTARYGVEELPTVAFISPGGRAFLRRSRFEDAPRFAATLQTARRLAGEVAPLEAALERDDDDPAALAALGVLLSENGLVAESRDLLRKARKGDASRPVAERKRTRRALAAAERHRGKTGDAERLLDEVLALQPADVAEDAAALFALGETYLERGQAEKARAAWQRALDLAPTGPVAPLASEALSRLPAR